MAPTLKMALAVVSLFAVGNTQTVGCGQEHDFIGKTRTFSIQSSGGDRSFSVHLPDNYVPEDARPLLLAYHGRGGTSKGMEDITRFSNPKVNPDMITVYPQGVNRSWEGPDYAVEGVSDKVFTTDLVDYLKENYCVDTDRVYASGFSNGGGFAASLACDKVHGAQFAAFAPIGAALYGETPENDAACAPAEVPVPMLELHGTDDQTIDYNGAIEAGGRVPAIPEWFDRWADRNECGEKVVDNLPNNVEHWTWDCGNDSGNPLLQHYKAEGLGHVWPNAAGPIDISTIIIDFFLNQSK